MGGMSIWHLLILMFIVLLIFGPSRLGDLGKSLGEAIRGFKKGLNEDPEIDVTATARRETLPPKDESKTHETTQTKEKEKV